MKTIGLIGGMSWESTVPYYRIVNQAVRERLGGLHSARAILYSVDFEDLEPRLRAGQWEEIGRSLAGAARALEGAGADFLVLCTNTMHRVAGEIEAAVAIPLLHIAEPTGEAVRRSGIAKVGLLGTRFTMEQGFLRERLRERHGLEVIVPGEADREMVNRVVFEELCLGRVLDASRAQYRRVIASLAASGAQGVIFGCTEIATLVGAGDSPVPVFDTTELHARAAVELALAA